MEQPSVSDFKTIFKRYKQFDNSAQYLLIVYWKTGYYAEVSVALLYI